MEELSFKLNEEHMMMALRNLVIGMSTPENLQEKKHKTMWDIFEDLDSISFNRLRNNIFFADFFRQVKIIVNNEDSQENYNNHHKSTTLDNDFKLSLYEGSFIVPNLSTPLEQVKLPTRFMKLFKRLKNASLKSYDFKVGETLQDVIDLTVNDVKNLNGVGIAYVETFKELKELVNKHNVNHQDLCDENKKEFDLLGIDTSNYSISMYGVEERFLKPLAKYNRHFNLPSLRPNIDDVLKFERDELLALPRFGLGVVDKLLEFKNVIIAEIRAIEQGKSDYMALQTKVIFPQVIDSISLQELDEILLNDIDCFLDKLNDDEIDIAHRRWGFIEKKETLEDLGIRHQLTRERIRQRETMINEQFMSNLRLTPESLWILLKPHMQPCLKDEIPDLFDCFSSEKDFYEFMEMILQKENLFEYVYPEVDKSILNDFFAENGAPLHIQEAINIIEESNYSNVKNTRNAIFNLQKQGIIAVEGDYLWPKSLSKSQASACVLVNNPKGLPWIDIAKLANKQGFSKSDLYEDRLDHEAFNNKDYIYLAGKGFYKHTCFISSGLISLDKVFSELKSYIENTMKEVFHLNECYQSSEYLKKINYYDIRHFVKHFGEDYGFYFYGRSQTDSVSINKEFKNITQKDVIIESMNKRKKPFTKPEVASLLKSRSVGHASFYLDGLVEEGKVVQVDYQLYTTPKQAYCNIDLDVYLNAMQNVLENYGKPVEASIFQQNLNPLLLVSYSKFFYASIARCFAVERGWYRAHGLYSINPIKYNNITAALNSLCKVDDPINVSIECLQEHIAINRENATTAIHNWRSMHNRKK